MNKIASDFKTIIYYTINYKFIKIYKLKFQKYFFLIQKRS